jgi:hypothetical protein
MSTNPIIYTLKHPVKIGSETITEVKFGRIKGKHMRSLPGDPKLYTLGTIMDLAGKVMGESSILLDEMDSEDVTGVCDIVGELLSAGQPTGETA